MLARVFPRRTQATPTDALAFIGEPPLFGLDGVTQVHVSVTWTYDLPQAEYLAASWQRTGLPVDIGGPATGMRGEDFIPGRYLKTGYVITSRGCPNRCWFCSVWKREGSVVRELPITEGHNVLDDNLLACSEGHIRAVFAMLAQQKEKAEFTGGLEAKKLRPWHVDLLASLKPQQAFFAYDTPDDYEPLVDAGRLLAEAGFSTKDRTMRCYVLCGYPKDTIDDADIRMRQTAAAGFFPMAMLYRDTKGQRDASWQQWARQWARPVIIANMLKVHPLERLDDLEAQVKEAGKKWMCISCGQELGKRGGMADTNLCGPCCTGEAATLEECGETW